jgi:sulfur carrier protein ThiS
MVAAVYSDLEPMSRLEDSPAADPMTITVTVVFFADLRRFLPRGENGPRRYALVPGATVADLLDTIGIAPGTDLTAAVDGELAARDTPLRDGAEVMLLSPMEGGSDQAPRPSCGPGRQGPPVPSLWSIRSRIRVWRFKVFTIDRPTVRMSLNAF